MQTTKESKWKPISEGRLLEEINKGVSKLLSADLNFWELIQIDPEKWNEKRYGKVGKGFWVVAIAGRRVIWYNDIEEGFNISAYRRYGEIDQYFSHQDDLDISVRRLFELVRFGDGK